MLSVAYPDDLQDSVLLRRLVNMHWLIIILYHDLERVAE